MLNRTAVKLNTRARMRGYLGNAILVSLIATLLGVTRTTIKFNFSTYTDDGQSYSVLPTYMQRFLKEYFPAVAAVIAGLAVVLIASWLLYTVFFSNVLRVGRAGWFMRYSRGEYPGVGQMFASFRIYNPSMVSMLLVDVYTFLWTLLFIIPGIVKAYAYRLVPYIIYENPSLPPAEALRISEQIMRGRKGELFIFDLSFIWWNLLSFITAGIVGIIYVDPYHSTAEAAVYDTYKWDAINSGLVSPQAFGIPTDAEN